MKLKDTNFTIYAGSTFSYVLKVTNDDGTNFNLTDYSARLVARKYAGGAVLIDSTGVDANCSVSLDIATATITIAMTAAQTAALTFETALYHLELSITIDAVVNTTRFLQGYLTLSKEVVY